MSVNSRTRTSLASSLLDTHLLVPKHRAVLSPSESEVGHEATAAVLHKDALLLGVRILAHFEVHIVQTGRLAHLVMDARPPRRRHLRHIDLQARNPAEEVVLVLIPVQIAL